MKIVDKACDHCGGREFSTIYPADEEKLRTLNLTEESFQCTSLDHEFFLRLARCERCSLVMVNPRPDDEFLMRLAENVNDPIYEHEQEGRFLTYQKALAEIDRVHPPEAETRYLDFSCYFGLFVETLTRAGREAFGIDICESIVERGNARLRGQRLFAGPFDRWDSILGGRKFDVVTSWDAIEHVHSPHEYLLKANEFLKPGGLLAVSTMNYDSLFARWTGRRWPWLMPMHLYYFTPATLRAELERSGFQPIRRTTYSHIVSLGYLLYKINNRLFGPLRGRKFFRDIHVPVNFGDFMTVYARKT